MFYYMKLKAIEEKGNLANTGIDRNNKCLNLPLKLMTVTEEGNRKSRKKRRRVLTKPAALAYRDMCERDYLSDHKAS